ncbi:hypothetical protein Poli38472_014196 [Pythium oligandrum]|uniref:Uncharacterized protein n=1 Tax=Pythium oligandrum TaxID=41045 RepID=A0A8K1FKD6_PYTOL|nr:hypothetical protein Poli38472_014196 [Pythium oligandrum]|eukprot:TMW64079.1 hypothetical protein Poli38472_014196 [Pythium oligandrum]
MTQVDAKTQELQSQAEVECTFQPKINPPPKRKPTRATTLSDAAASRYDEEEEDMSSYSLSPRSLSPSAWTRQPSTYASQINEPMDDEEDDGIRAARIHPTESQEASIQLYLARQGRAREDARRAQKKLLSTQPPKDFARVTTAQPFELSVSNRKPRRASSASPTGRSRSRPRTPSHSTANGSRAVASGRRTQPMPNTTTTNTTTGLTNDSPRQTLDDDEPTPVHPDTEAWQAERTTLLAIIDSQRQELETRDRVHNDASRLADSFALAVQTFEERLVAMEQSTATRLRDVSRQLAQQTAATELLLHSLGLALPPPPSSPTNDRSDP